MNLQEVLQTLIESGLSETEIAQRIGVSQPTVNRIKNGADPAYRTGKQLERLYRAVRRRRRGRARPSATAPGEGNRPEAAGAGRRQAATAAGESVNPNGGPAPARSRENHDAGYFH